MIRPYAPGRTAVFIDATNIYFSQKSLGWRVDLQKLIKYLKRETNLVRIAFYGALNPDNEKEKKFHDFLEIIGYTVRHKEIKFIKDNKKNSFGGHHKGNIDVELTIDAVHLKDQYDTFILFSGDSDFESLVKYLKGFQKRCLVISTIGHISFELIKQAKFIDFKELRHEIDLHK